MCARHNGGDNNVDDKTASPYGRDDSFPTAVVVVIIVLTLLTLTRTVFVVVLLHMFLGQSRCHCTLAASVPLCGSAKLDAVLYCTAIYQLISVVTAEQVEQCRCVCPVTPFGPV